MRSNVDDFATDPVAISTRLRSSTLPSCRSKHGPGGNLVFWNSNISGRAARSLSKQLAAELGGAEGGRLSDTQGFETASATTCFRRSSVWGGGGQGPDILPDQQR
jgi:hypothetical protein